MDSQLMGIDNLPRTGPGDDLSSIAWVHEELRRSLEAAHKSLRRFLKDAETVTGSDIDSVDPGVLRAARSQIHQGVGALELVGLRLRRSCCGRAKPQCNARSPSRNRSRQSSSPISRRRRSRCSTT
jgi:hypothetical protein